MAEFNDEVVCRIKLYRLKFLIIRRFIESREFSISIDGLDAGSFSNWFLFDDREGLIYANPLNGDVGEYDITISASDILGDFESETFKITVENVNDAPQIDLNIDGALTIEGFLEREHGSHQIKVLDIDIGDTHTYSIESLKFAAPNGVLSGYN